MYERIFVPVDGSPTSMRGLDEAIRLGRLTGGRLLLAHVVDELVFVTGFETGVTYLNDVLPELRRRGEEVLEAARTRVAAASLAVETRLLECFASRTSDVLLKEAEAWAADVVVLGTHGRRGFRRLMLGSDAEQLVRASSVPVLLVRGLEPTQDGTIGAAAGAAATGAARVATATL
jgi:nucleotide-binding universal stress UspA family protein